MNDHYQKILNDFIYHKGDFADIENYTYVDPHDLYAARFYHTAAKQLLSRAKNEESPIERQRLIALAEWQFDKVERILERYGL